MQQEDDLHSDQNYYGSRPAARAFPAAPFVPPAAPLHSPPPSPPPPSPFMPPALPARIPGLRYRALAVLLAIAPGIVFLFGFGHIYAGAWRRGLAYLCGYWSVFVLLANVGPAGMYAFVWLALLIWTPIDAARLVRRRNTALMVQARTRF